MSVFLHIYAWPIAGGAFFAIVLALLGCHLAARDRSMQTLCVGQAATLGILLGIGIVHTSFEEEAQIHYSPILLGFCFSVLAFYLGEWAVRPHQSSRNSYYTAIFVSLLAAASLVSAILPGLETHLSQVFFGDLATLSDRDAHITLAGAVASLIVLIWGGRALANASFEVAIFGFSSSSSALFNFFSLLVLAFSVQFLGFLFTASCLFVPTTLLSYARARRLNVHLVMAALLAGTSAFLGFLLSLRWERLPTVPTIVGAMLALGTLVVLTSNAISRVRSHA